MSYYKWQESCRAVFCAFFVRPSLKWSMIFKRQGTFLDTNTWIRFKYRPRIYNLILFLAVKMKLLMRSIYHHHQPGTDLALNNRIVHQGYLEKTKQSEQAWNQNGLCWKQLTCYKDVRQISGFLYLISRNTRRVGLLLWRNSYWNRQCGQKPYFLLQDYFTQKEV
jgi:hypothetical protein